MAKNNYFSELKKEEVVKEEQEVDQLMLHRHDPILFSNMQNFWARAKKDKQEWQSRKIIHKK